MPPRRPRQRQCGRTPTQLQLAALLPVCFALAAGAAFQTSRGGPYVADVIGLYTAASGWTMTDTGTASLVVSDNHTLHGTS